MSAGYTILSSYQPTSNALLPTGLAPHFPEPTPDPLTTLFWLLRQGDGASSPINDQPRGAVETLMDLYLPAAGRYTIRIRGIQEVVQLYELNIHLHGTPVPEPATLWLGIPLVYLLAAAWYQRPSR